MPRTIRYHLDEQVSQAVAEGLRRRGVNVTTTDDAGLLGMSDSDHILFAVSQNRVIFTQDEDFLRLHDEGMEHAGLVYCHQQKHTIGKLIEGLILLWEVYEPAEMMNRREFL